jgi:DNA modification methylase
LRDYGTAAWDGGVRVGDNEECDHKAARQARGDRAKGGLQGGTATVDASDMAVLARDYCLNCGARRIDQQLGLEATPEEYVAGMVAVFREVRRVLRDDGTLWLNIGDSYAANRGYQVPDSKHIDVGNSRGMKAECFGLKPKDLVGIPWMLAFALRADGWYLRSDIIWSKPNPMPESVTDRPTKAHEYLFLLSKRATYYYDAAAIAESAIHVGRVVEYDGTQKNSAAAATDIMRTRIAKDTMVGDTRNKRTVWTIATEPYPEAHFATFPTALVTPCVLAGCPEGGTVLEPFAGSGTTLAVAKQLGRKSIGIELNADYCGLAERRLMAITQPMFAGEVA